MLRALRWLFLLLPACASAGDEPRWPAYLLQAPDGVRTVFIAETGASALHRFDVGPASVRHVDARYMSVGSRGVGKQRAWDRRTPLGIYFVSDRLDTRKLHERYGPTAFPLDYPNAWDRRSGRTGDGIWIHGVVDDDERRPPLDTDGCIALPNAELLRIETLLQPAVTPVIITRELRWATADEIRRQQAALSAALQQWADSIRDGNLHRYLGLYAAEFRWRGMSRDEWAAFRAATLGAQRVESLTLDNIWLLADPEVDALYLSRFRQTLVEDGASTVMTKRLYWKRTGAGFLVVAEDNG